jgi:Zn-dependent peptidase ImmA (M78 family)/predicted secreted protein
MDYRQATLRGSRGASEAHNKFGLKSKIKEGLQQIDIFECLKELNITTLCRPLDGLLGAYSTDGHSSGILISTNRRLPVQRFTAAHEFGHFWLGHKDSVDSEASISALRSGKGVAAQEVEAEAFAAEFILPRVLIGHTIRRQNYTKSDLKQPDVMYQLSLRLGVSYSAIRVALASARFISQPEADLAAKTVPKQIKQRLLKEFELPASHPDIFYLTEHDNSAYIMSDESDILIVDLPEHSASGYVWNDTAQSENLTTLFDINYLENKESVGGISRRKRVLTGSNRTNLKLEETRPWEQNVKPISQYDVTLDFRGKESGLPRAFRQ